jgi:hypothetical protein
MTKWPNSALLQHPHNDSPTNLDNHTIRTCLLRRGKERGHRLPHPQSSSLRQRESRHGVPFYRLVRWSRPGSNGHAHCPYGSESAGAKYARWCGSDADKCHHDDCGRRGKFCLCVAESECCTARGHGVAWLVERSTEYNHQTCS